MASLGVTSEQPGGLPFVTPVESRPHKYTLTSRLCGYHLVARAVPRIQLLTGTVAGFERLSGYPEPAENEPYADGGQHP
jgi:hypothetical protein